MATFIDEMKIRGGMESPPFFQKLGKIGRNIAKIAAIITIVSTTVVTMGVALPVIIPSIAAGLTVLGETIKKVSDLAVEDKDGLNDALKTDI